MKRLSDLVPALVLAVYALACLVYGVDTLWHPQWDAGMYLLTARSLARHEGYTYLGQPFFLRPPGFAWLLSWVVGRDGDFNFHALNFLTMSFGVATVVAAYALMTRFHARWRALAIALLLGTSPLFVAQWNTVMSEFLFLALFLAGLIALLPSVDDEDASRGRAFLGTAMIVASVYVRTAGLVLLPALLVRGGRGSGRRPRHFAIAPFLLAIALLAPWVRYASEAERTAPRPATQLLNFSYTTPIFHAVAGDPDSRYVTLDGWIQRIEQNSRTLVVDLERQVFFLSGWPGHLAIALVALGLASSLMNTPILALLALAYAGLLLIYPYYDSRLVLPLLFFVYHHLMVGADRFARVCARPFGGDGAAAAATTAVLATVLLCLNLGAIPESSRSTPTTDKFPLTAAAAWVKEHSAEDAVILVDHAPEFSVLSGRRCFSTMYLGKAPLPETDYVVVRGAPAPFEAGFREHNLGLTTLPSASDPRGIRIYRVR